MARKLTRKRKREREGKREIEGKREGWEEREKDKNIKLNYLFKYLYFLDGVIC